jgi:plasmid maintenance system killer protein
MVFSVIDQIKSLVSGRSDQVHANGSLEPVRRKLAESLDGSFLALSEGQDPESIATLVALAASGKVTQLKNYWSTQINLGYQITFVFDDRSQEVYKVQPEQDNNYQVSQMAYRHI